MREIFAPTVAIVRTGHSLIAKQIEQAMIIAVKQCIADGLLLKDDIVRRRMKDARDGVLKAHGR